MSSDHKKILSYFKFRRIIIPVIIGLIVASYLVIRNFDKSAFENIHWTYYSTLSILIAMLLMGVRDVAYMYRIRLLTDKQLSWRQSFDVIMLWEFASSVTPSIVGGSAIALFIVNKEGIGIGRSTAIVMVTALLDELFYIIMVPIVFIIVGTKNLFITEGEFALFNTELGTKAIFIIGYVFILFLTSVIIFAVFFRPRGFKWILLRVFKIPFLRKWRVKASEAGDDIITTSREMKSKPISFWLKAYFATLCSWTARFWVVNFLIMAVITINDHFLIYARQLIMWVILLISPTPGGSGVAEFVFSDFLGEFITPGLSPALAILWRLISYYLYLFIGVIILPNWLKRVYSKKNF
ncbi:MAG: flippase-like domain-containing protein [Bacteroidales bacterium]|nr:flippase-like domain-containing protein [Bacteroidales bacterium]